MCRMFLSLAFANYCQLLAFNANNSKTLKSQTLNLRMFLETIWKYSLEMYQKRGQATLDSDNDSNLFWHNGALEILLACFLTYLYLLTHDTYSASDRVGQVACWTKTHDVLTQSFLGVGRNTISEVHWMNSNELISSWIAFVNAPAAARVQNYGSWRSLLLLLQHHAWAACLCRLVRSFHFIKWNSIVIASYSNRRFGIFLFTTIFWCNLFSLQSSVAVSRIMISTRNVVTLNSTVARHSLRDFEHHNDVF